MLPEGSTASPVAVLNAAEPAGPSSPPYPHVVPATSVGPVLYTPPEGVTFLTRQLPLSATNTTPPAPSARADGRLNPRVAPPTLYTAPAVIPDGPVVVAAG